MRLCALLGIPTRNILMHLLSWPELCEWRELYQVDPWDQDRADLRAGQIAAATLAPWSKRKPAPIDFMPYVKKPQQRRLSQKQMKAILEHAARNFEKARAAQAKKKARAGQADGASAPAKNQTEAEASTEHRTPKTENHGQ